MRLRPWTTDDVAALAAAWTDPEVARWTGVPPHPDEAYAKRWILGETDRRARGLALDLVIEVDGAVAGEVGITCPQGNARVVEMGWWVAPTHRGQGIAKQAAALVAEWAVAELCVDSVLARCHPDNPASGGVARGAGFTMASAPSGAEACEVWQMV